MDNFRGNYIEAIIKPTPYVTLDTKIKTIFILFRINNSQINHESRDSREIYNIDKSL